MRLSANEAVADDGTVRGDGVITSESIVDVGDNP